MLSIPVIGILSVLSGTLLAVVIFIVCRIFRKRKRQRTYIAGHEYEAVGDCKPPSLMSVSSGSQEFTVKKESRAVQPRRNTMSSTRSSVRSDTFTESTSVSTARGSLPSTVYTDDTSSISARSDMSSDSCVFEAGFGAIRPDLYPRKDAVLQQSSLDKSSGRLHVRLKYDFRTSDFVIHLIEAQDLPVIGEIGTSSDPYVKLFIVPEVDERVRQSSVKRRTANPFYNEYYKFPVPFDDLKDRTLLFHIYDFDKFSRHNMIGEVQVDLSQVDVSNSVEMWCDIQKHQKKIGDFGDLLLSLSYLPTAERLTVVVMKAKELRLSNPSADPYVKVCLISEGKRIKRKKTSVKKAGGINPVWNEALAFNVPTEMLPNVSIECLVMDHDLIGHNDFIGKCVIGGKRHGSEGNHWTDMTMNHRKSIAMWHHLHK